MYLEYDKSASIKENNIRTLAVEQFLLQQPEVASVFSNVGGPSTGIGSLGDYRRIGFFFDFNGLSGTGRI